MLLTGRTVYIALRVSLCEGTSSCDRLQYVVGLWGQEVPVLAADRPSHFEHEQDGSVGGRVLTARHLRRGEDEFIECGLN